VSTDVAPTLVESDSRLESTALADERRALEHTWANPSGLVGWLSEVDHKAIGRRFIATAFAFFTLGGILSGLMRRTTRF
jgi:hypothetical protein